MSTCPADDRSTKRRRIEPPLAKRDTEGYHEDGDCVIRAENTLFKLHGFFIKRDSSVLRGLLEGDSKGAAVEGTDDAPLNRQGDKAQDWRCYIRYRYATPNELLPGRFLPTALPHLISFSRFASGYDMKEWAVWPHGILAHLIRTHANVYALQDFTSLLDFAHELHHELLREATVIAWMQQIVSGRLSSADAMQVGERLGDRGFLTGLYEHVLREQLSLFSLEQNARGPAAALNPSNRVDLGLPPLHAQRILSAYSTLTRAWAQLRQTPPPLLQHPQCKAASAPVPAERHTTACLNAHVNLWRVTFASVDAMPIPWTANGMRQRLEGVRNILLKGQVPGDVFGGYCRYVPSLARDDFLMNCFASVPLTTRRYLFGDEAEDAAAVRL